MERISVDKIIYFSLGMDSEIKFVYIFVYIFNIFSC